MTGPGPDRLAEVIAETFRSARGDGLGIDAAAAVVAEAIRRHLDDSAAATVATVDLVEVQSILGARSGQPLVQCRVGLERWEWGVNDARSHAAKVFAVAEAAEHDAAVYRWLTLGHIGMGERPAMQAVGDLRRFRGDPERVDWRMPPAGGPGDDAAGQGGTKRQEPTL